MKLLKRLSCFIVAASLAISCVACTKEDTTWAFEYDGKSIGAGVYIGMTMSAYMQASYMVEDYTQNILTQYVEEVPAKEWIIDKALELSNRFIAVENEFERLGLELTEEQVKQVDDELKMLWNSAGEIYESNGVGRNSYRMIIENSKKEEALFVGYYGEGGTDEVSDDELYEFYENEYAIINAMSIAKDFDFEEVTFDGMFDENGDLIETDEEVTDEELTDEEATDEEVTDEESTDEESTDEESTDEEVIEEEVIEEEVIAPSVDPQYERAMSYAERISDGESFNAIVAEYTKELEEEAEAQAELEAELNGEQVFDIEYIDAEDAEEFKANLENGTSTEDDEESAEEDEESTEEDEESTEEDEVSTEEDDVEILDDEDTKFPIARSSTQPSADFVNQLFQLPKNGKAEVIEDATVYYVIIRYETEKDDNYELMKESLMYQMKDVEFGELVDELIEKVQPTSINNASITRYDPKNISI